MENIDTRAIPQDLAEVDSKAIMKPRHDHAIRCRSGLRRLNSQTVDLGDVTGAGQGAPSANARPDLIARFIDKKQRVVIGLAGGIGRHFLVRYQRPWGKTALSKQVRIFLQAVEFANGLLPQSAAVAASAVEVAMERRDGNPDLAPGTVWEVEQGAVRCAVVRRGFVSYGVRVFVDGRKVTETFPFNLPGAIGQARQLAASLQGWTRMT